MLYDELAKELVKNSKSKVNGLDKAKGIDVISQLSLKYPQEKSLKLFLNKCSLSILELVKHLGKTSVEVETSLKELKNDQLIYESYISGRTTYHLTMYGIYKLSIVMGTDLSVYFKNLDSHLFRYKDLRLNRPEIVLVTFLLVKGCTSAERALDLSNLSNSTLGKYFKIAKEIDKSLYDEVAFDTKKVKSKIVGWDKGKFINFKGILKGTDHIKHTNIWGSPGKEKYFLDLSVPAKSNYLINLLFQNVRPMSENYNQRQNYKRCLYRIIDEYLIDLNPLINELDERLIDSLNMN